LPITHSIARSFGIRKNNNFFFISNCPRGRGRAQGKTI